MAIIEREGWYNGERVGKCSDLAQLHWARLFLAADAYGRLELTYRRVVRTVYISFQNPPTEAEFETLIKEYHKHRLLFLYEDEIGQRWAQWYCLPRCLPRYQTARDKRSPIPNETECRKWLGLRGWAGPIFHTHDNDNDEEKNEPERKRKRTGGDSRPAEAAQPEPKTGAAVSPFRMWSDR